MDAWNEGTHYDDYMGRWSQPMAAVFLDWLDVPADSDWLDVGCGTGALAGEIVAHAHPRSVSGVDPSPGFIASAARRLGGAADLRVGDAQALPFDSSSFHASVSGLVLNFIPDPVAAITELRRVTRDNGVAAVYLWDYAEGMEMIRVFWDVAVGIDPSIARLDEATRFPLCGPEPLRDAFEGAGLEAVEVAALEIPTVFRDFDDYWTPLLGGQGPIPSYVMSLEESDRQNLQMSLERALPRVDGRIPLVARAWAGKATC